MKNVFKAAAVVVVMIAGLASQSKAQTKQDIIKMQAEIKRLTTADQLVQEHLKKIRYAGLYGFQ